jgi:hypothetical protein
VAFAWAQIMVAVAAQCWLTTEAAMHDDARTADQPAT